MPAKKKGPGKGRGPGNRPPSPSKRTTVPKPAPASPPAPGQQSAAGKASTGGQPGAARTGGSSNPASGPAQAAKATATPAKAAKAAAVPAKAAAGGAGGVASTKGRAGGGPTREERMAAAEAARRKRTIRNRALLAGGVAAVVFVVGFVLVSDRRERGDEAAQFQTGSCRFDRATDPDQGPGRNHVPTPTYEVDPPAGGDHTPQAARPGIFTDANTPPDGQIVHALEHGYVVLWHRPDLDPQTLTTLREVAQKFQPNVLMVPRPSLDTPVAATAWHVRLQCDTLEVDALERFISTFLDKAPEKGFITDRGPAG